MLWLNLFFFFPRSHFFILRSRYVGTGSNTYYSWVSLREKWMIASFSSCGCDKVPCDVTWLWLGLTFRLSRVLFWLHIFADPFTPSVLSRSLLSGCCWLHDSSFLPLLDCTLIIFSFCLFLLSPVSLHWYFSCCILLPQTKWQTNLWLHMQFYHLWNNFLWNHYYNKAWEKYSFGCFCCLCNCLLDVVCNLQIITLLRRRV